MAITMNSSSRRQGRSNALKNKKGAPAPLGYTDDYLSGRADRDRYRYSRATARQNRRRLKRRSNSHGRVMSDGGYIEKTNQSRFKNTNNYLPNGFSKLGRCDGRQRIYPGFKECISPSY